MMNRALLRIVLTAPLLAAAGPAAPPGDRPLPVLVSAVASVAPVLERIGAKFTARTGVEVRVTGGGPVLLAQQIIRGAPADVFVSAGGGPMQKLLFAKMIDEASSFAWLGNRLVVVARADRAVPLDTPEEIVGVNTRRLAMVDPDLVPTGGYARQSLRKLALWDRVQDRVIISPDAPAALATVESGEADLGIVYQTDALLAPRVRVVLEIPDDAHEPIRYPVARVSHAGASTAVGRFLEFLRGDEARKIVVEAGFIPVYP